MNRLLSLSNSDNEALWKVIQDCFLLPDDDSVDDSEVESDGDWRVANDQEGTYIVTLKHNHHNMPIISLHAETISSERREDTASVWAPIRTEKPRAKTLIRVQQ